MSLTRSQTKTQREAPGLYMLVDAIMHIEQMEKVNELKQKMNSFIYDMAMPHDNAAKDNVEQYIDALEKVVLPRPPTPRVGYTQYYDHNRKMWVFCKVYPVDRHGNAHQ